MAGMSLVPCHRGQVDDVTEPWWLACVGSRSQGTRVQGMVHCISLDGSHEYGSLGFAWEALVAIVSVGLKSQGQEYYV